MKNFLVAFLVFVFSVQGAVAAFGVDIPASPLAHAKHILMPAMVDATDASNDAERPHVSPAHEELSDYVAFNLKEHIARDAAFMPRPPLVFPISIDLPRIKPPPRV